MNKIKLVYTISMITIIGGILFGCNNESSKPTVNETSNNVISDSDSIKSEETIDNTQINEDIKTTDMLDVVSKVEGKRKEYIERLDSIQKELDELPDKKDADAGVTNAMKNYYGKAYEMYDKELNDIYALLKEELSPDIMNDLEIKQLKWIEEKEKKAREEEAKFQGGTFEHVAGYIVLYEATKGKCYELVNEYMAD